MDGNITTADLSGKRSIRTNPLYQYDYGQILKIVGVDLPMAYEVHFSNEPHGVATTQIGNADGVVIIPDIYLTTALPVYVWLYLHTGETDGETEYTVTIPVIQRASISNQEPTPVQQDMITQAIAALDAAVAQTAQDVQDATEAKQDAEEAAGEAYESAVTAGQYATTAGGHAADAAEASHNAEYQAGRAEQAHLDAQAAQWAAESAQTAAEAAQAGAVAARTGAETAQAWAVAARSGAEAAQHAAEAARDEITGLSATANTLPAGSQATASYADGTLTLGIPQGAKGDTGDTGATPDLTIGTVETLPAGSSATATITGTAEDPVLNLGIPKGDQGEVSQAEFDALADDVSDMQDTLEHKADINGYYTDMTVGNAEQLVSSQYVEDAEPYKFRTSGGSADIGNREYLDKVVGGTVAWNQQVRDEASENQTDYADVVTVTDAVVDDAAVSVNVEPVQDLHGYDSPWPAGGGKNLLPKGGTNATYQGVAVSYDSENEIYTLNGTVNSVATIYLAFPRVESMTLSPDKTYSISCKVVSGSFVLGDDSSTNNTYSVACFSKNLSSYFRGSLSLPESALDGYSGYGRGFETESYYCILVQCWKVGTVFNNLKIRIQIEEGQTATAWTPYENLCPISGWDEVKVTRTGKNLYNFATYQTITRSGVTCTNNGDGSFTLNGTATNDTYFDVFRPQFAPAQGGTPMANAEYCLSGCPSGGGGQKYFLYTTPNYHSDYGSGNTFTDSVNGGSIFVKNGYTCDNLVFRPQICFASAPNPMEFVPYSGSNTYTIQMPTEAGTVYGGVLTVNADGTGSLLVDRYEHTFNGTEASLALDSAANVVRFTGAKGVSNQISLAKYVYSHGIGDASSTSIMLDNSFGVRTTGFCYLKNSACTTLQDFKDWFAAQYAAGTPVQISYIMAEPQIYSLTASQVRTLLGTNHVWSDAGQVALTYTGTDEHLTLTSGRKYLSRISGTDSMVLGAGQTVTAVKGQDNVFDLTQMFGTAVADYVYQQGAGYFRRWFGGSHYAYNAGELLSVEGLQSHDTVGFNIFNPADIVEGKFINDDNGEERDSTGAIATGWMPVVGGTKYYIKHDATSGNWGAWYDAEKNYISGLTGTGIKTSPANARYVRFTVKNQASSTGSPDALCINLSNNGTHNGEYQPYEKHSYPLDSTLTLRGIPKVGSNGVYWDGDEYEYDGAVKRRYGVIDMGTMNWGMGFGGFYSNSNSQIMPSPSSSSTMPNIACAKYATNTYVAIGDKEISVIYGGSGYQYNGYIVIKDASYASADSFKAAMSGVYLIYELATPTDETATPYQQIQQVDDWGTEEFVSTSIVPVGHATRYPANLRDKIQHLPDLANEDGNYLIVQDGSQMTLAKFRIPQASGLANGTYVLKATVVNGTPTYTWVQE